MLQGSGVDCCLPREGGSEAGRAGGDVRNRETWRGIRRRQRRGGLTLEKVRDTCLFPLIVTRAANTRHPVEGPTARRLLPWQPDQLPW